jgi:hypothetical protein
MNSRPRKNAITRRGCLTTFTPIGTTKCRPQQPTKDVSKNLISIFCPLPPHIKANVFSLIYYSGGSDFTGGHYDPGLACGSASQNAATFCAALGRTSGDGYTYNCNPAGYAAGNLALCEVGDISSKFGRLFPKSETDLIFSVDHLEDVQPPYVGNYMQPTDVGGTLITPMWSSIVFHCGATGARLACAKFSVEDLQPCTDAMKDAGLGYWLPDDGLGGIARGIFQTLAR